MVFKQNEKIICSIFLDVSFKNQLQQLPLVNRFCQNSPNKKNLKLPSLKVPGLAILELRQNLIVWANPPSPPLLGLSMLRAHSVP